MFFVGARGIRCAAFCFLAVRLFAADVTLRGRVVDEASAPVPGAAITVRMSAQSSASVPAIQTTADPTGTFHVTLPNPGAYLITISQADFFRLVDRPVDVAAGSNEIVLTLNHIRNTSDSVDVRSSPSPIDI